MNKLMSDVKIINILVTWSNKSCNIRVDEEHVQENYGIFSELPAEVMNVSINSEYNTVYREL